MGASISGLRDSRNLWREGAGYYTQTPEQLRERPLEVEPHRLRDRRILRLFERYADLHPGSRVLEIGCGRSRWLPYLALKGRCTVAGVDCETFAVELARANLEGAGARGEFHCRDGFAPELNRDLFGKFDLVYSMGVLEHFDDPVRRLEVLAQYLRRGGRILTTVPNLRGVNQVLQWLGDVERLEMHLIYDPESLARVHREAGLEVVASGCAGFVDGYLSAEGETAGWLRKRLQQRLCRSLSLGGELWARTLGRFAAPEMGWLSPHVFCVGRKA